MDPLLVIALAGVAVVGIATYVSISTYVIYMFFFSKDMVDMSPNNTFLFSTALQTVQTLLQTIISRTLGAALTAGGKFFLALPKLVLLAGVFTISALLLYNAGPVGKAWIVVRTCGIRDIAATLLNPPLDLLRFAYNLAIGGVNWYREMTRILEKETRAIALTCAFENDVFDGFVLIGAFLNEFFTALSDFLRDSPFLTGRLVLVPSFEAIGDILDFLKTLLTCACPILEFAWDFVRRVLQLPTLHVALEDIANTAVALVQIIPNAIFGDGLTFTPLADELVNALTGAGDAIEDAVFILIEFIVGLVLTIIDLVESAEVVALRKRQKAAEFAGETLSDAELTLSPMARLSLLAANAQRQMTSSTPANLSPQEAARLYQIMYPSYEAPAKHRTAYRGMDAKAPLNQTHVHDSTLYTWEQHQAIQNIEAQLFEGVIPDEVAYYLAPTPGFTRIVTEAAAAVVRIAEIVLNAVANINLIFVSEFKPPPRETERWWDWSKVFFRLRQAAWAISNLTLIMGPYLNKIIRYGLWVVISVVYSVFELISRIFYYMGGVSGNPLDFLYPFYSTSAGMADALQYSDLMVDNIQYFVSSINQPLGTVAGGILKTALGGGKVMVQIIFSSWEIIQFGNGKVQDAACPTETNPGDTTGPVTANCIQFEIIFAGAAQVAVGARNFFWQFEGNDISAAYQYVDYDPELDTNENGKISWDEYCPENPAFFCCLGDVFYNLARMAILLIAEIIYFGRAILGAAALDPFGADDAPDFEEIITALETAICRLGCTIGRIIPIELPCVASKRECADGRDCIGGIMCAVARLLTGIFLIVNGIYRNLVEGQSPFADFVEFFIPFAKIMLDRIAGVVYALADLGDCLICLVGSAGRCGDDRPIYGFIFGFMDPIIDLVVNVGAILLNAANLIVRFFTNLFGGDPLGAIWGLITGLFNLFVVDLGKLILSFLKRMPVIGDIISFFEGLKRGVDWARGTVPPTTVEMLVAESRLDLQRLPNGCRSVVDTNYDRALIDMDRNTAEEVKYCIAVYSWANIMPAHAQTRAPYTYKDAGSPADPPLEDQDPRIAAIHDNILSACDRSMLAYAEEQTEYHSLRPIERAYALECQQVWRVTEETKVMASIEWLPSDILYNPTRAVIYPTQVISEGYIWYQYHSDRMRDPSVVASQAYRDQWAEDGLWTGHYDTLIQGNASKVEETIQQYSLYDYLLRNNAHHPEAVMSVSRIASALRSLADDTLRNATLNPTYEMGIMGVHFYETSEEYSRAQYQSGVNIMWNAREIYRKLYTNYDTPGVKRAAQVAWEATRTAGHIALNQAIDMTREYLADWSAYNVADARIQFARQNDVEPDPEDLAVYTAAINDNRLFTAGNGEDNAVSAQAIKHRWLNMTITPASRNNPIRRAAEQQEFLTLLPRNHFSRATREAALEQFRAYQTALEEPMGDRQDFQKEVARNLDLITYLSKGTPSSNVRAAKIGVISSRFAAGFDVRLNVAKAPGAASTYRMPYHRDAFLMKFSSDMSQAQSGNVDFYPEQCGTYLPTFLCEQCPWVANIVERVIDATLFLLDYYQSNIFVDGFMWAREDIAQDDANLAYAIVGNNATLPVRFPNPNFPTSEYLDPGRVENDGFIDLLDLLYGGNSTTGNVTEVIAEPPTGGAEIGDIIYAGTSLVFRPLIDYVRRSGDVAFSALLDPSNPGSPGAIALFFLDWTYTCDYRNEFDSTKQHQSLGESIYFTLRVLIMGTLVIGTLPVDFSLVTALVSSTFMMGVLYAQLVLTYNWSIRCFPSLPWMLANDIMFLYRRVLFPACELLFSGVLTSEYNNQNCLSCDAMRQSTSVKYGKDVVFADIRYNIVFTLNQWYPDILERLIAFPMIGSLLIQPFFQPALDHYNNLPLENPTVYGNNHLFNMLSLLPNILMWSIFVELAVIALPLAAAAIAIALALVVAFIYLVIMGLYAFMSLLYLLMAQQGVALELYLPDFSPELLERVLDGKYDSFF